MTVRKVSSRLPVDYKVFPGTVEMDNYNAIRLSNIISYLVGEEHESRYSDNFYERFSGVVGATYALYDNLSYIPSILVDGDLKRLLAIRCERTATRVTVKFIWRVEDLK